MRTSLLSWGPLCHHENPYANIRTCANIRTPVPTSGPLCQHQDHRANIRPLFQHQDPCANIRPPVHRTHHPSLKVAHNQHIHQRCCSQRPCVRGGGLTVRVMGTWPKHVPFDNIDWASLLRTVQLMGTWPKRVTFDNIDWASLLRTVQLMGTWPEHVDFDNIDWASLLRTVDSWHSKWTEENN